MLESECYNVTKPGKLDGAHLTILNSEVKNSTLILDTGSYIRRSTF